MSGVGRRRPPAAERTLRGPTSTDQVRQRVQRLQPPGPRQVVEIVWVAIVIGGLAWVAFVGAVGGLGVDDHTSRGTSSQATARSGAAAGPGLGGAESTERGGIVGTRPGSPPTAVTQPASASTTSTTVAVPSTVPVDLAAIAVSVVGSLPPDATPVESDVRRCRRAGDGVEVEVAVAHDAPGAARIAVLVAVHEPDGSVRARAAAITRPVARRTAEVIVVPVAGAGGQGRAGCTVEHVQALVT
jgi:hypothetical protein